MKLFTFRQTSERIRLYQGEGKTKMLNSFKALYFTTLFTLLSPISALAANIYISPSIERSDRYVDGGRWYAGVDEKGCQIIINGVIENGDFDKIRSIFDTGITFDPSGGEVGASGPYICMDSPGGSLSEAIKIATLIKDRSMTVVLPNAHCESACSIIFMAGSLNGEVSRKIYSSSKLGFHAPELKLEGSNYSAESVSKAYDLAIVTTAKIVELQIMPMHALEMLTSTPHSSMTYVETVDDLLKSDIGLVRGFDHESGYYSNFKELPALSAEQMVANICEYSYRMKNNSFTGFVGYDSFSVTKSGIKGTVLIKGDHEDFSFPCKVSISAGTDYCAQEICFYEGSVDSSYTNNPRFDNVLPFWTGQTKLSEMHRQAMSLDQFTQLIRSHRNQSSWSCAVDKRSAEVTNVQNFTNLRHQAGLNGRVTGQVPLGAMVTVVNPGQFLRYDRCAAACNGINQNAIRQCIDNNDVWIEVQYKGRRGFLSRKFLE